jgi:hypothetical protein
MYSKVHSALEATSFITIIGVDFQLFKLTNKHIYMDYVQIQNFLNIRSKTIELYFNTRYPIYVPHDAVTAIYSLTEPDEELRGSGRKTALINVNEVDFFLLYMAAKGNQSAVDLLSDCIRKPLPERAVNAFLTQSNDTKGEDVMLPEAHTSSYTRRDLKNAHIALKNACILYGYPTRFCQDKLTLAVLGIKSNEADLIDPLDCHITESMDDWKLSHGMERMTIAKNLFANEKLGTVDEKIERVVAKLSQMG